MRAGELATATQVLASEGLCSTAKMPSVHTPALQQLAPGLYLLAQFGYHACALVVEHPVHGTLTFDPHSG